MWKMMNHTIARTMAVMTRKQSVYHDRYHTPSLSHSGQTRNRRKKKARPTQRTSQRAVRDFAFSSYTWKM